MSNLSDSLGQISLEDNQAASTMHCPSAIFRQETRTDAPPSQKLIPEHILSQLVKFYVEMDLRGKVLTNMDIKISLVETDASVFNTIVTTDVLAIFDAIQHYSQVFHYLQYLSYERQRNFLLKYERLTFEFVERNDEYAKECKERGEEIRRKCGCTRFCSVGKDNQIARLHYVKKNSKFEIKDPKEKLPHDFLQVVDLAVFDSIHYMWHCIPKYQYVVGMSFKTIPSDPFEMYQEIIPRHILLSVYDVIQGIKNYGRRTISIEWTKGIQYMDVKLA